MCQQRHKNSHAEDEDDYALIGEALYLLREKLEESLKIATEAV